MIVLTLLMILVLIAPVLYLLLSVSIVCVLVRYVKAKKTIGFLVTCAVLIYPSMQLVSFFELKARCDEQYLQNARVVSSVPQRILYALEVNEGGTTPPIFLDSIAVNRNYFHTASIYKGEISPIKECRANPEICEMGNEPDYRYLIYVTHPHDVPGAGLFEPMVSKTQVIERSTKAILAERTDYVILGFIGIYHGLLNGHKGYLSCGYSTADVGAWRPQNDRVRTAAYREADAKFIVSVFPFTKP